MTESQTVQNADAASQMQDVVPTWIFGAAAFLAGYVIMEMQSGGVVYWIAS